ncbi:uncharacterized protein J4E87_009393 [Alternaria ethzedia]|uniref:uncharacterized protein n=1 Tax=Alternaria ethzedia TaxID=181014 RepID=UPI0020C35685|nr:uncharacterized protein J4E87_009393 [Alternaria ethzedia]KAI4614593.1 hypothetical protein J4E87_009393 [Alternaria ethzedia]
MLLVRPHRLPSRLACLLFATVATATISSSNTSTARTNLYDGTLPLTNAQGDDGTRIADLIPLTKDAANSVQGNLYNTNYTSVVGISNDEIAYISCDTTDYNGYDTAQGVFEQTYLQGNISAVILYSRTSDYCNYTQDKTQVMMDEFAIYSMTNRADSAKVRNDIIDMPAAMKYFVQVKARDEGNNDSGNGQYQQNPLGPSPSTAVAMIILYSITGIITALFLVIIITGAVRAHRHPERYGPRNVLGRPRQSRARGLGRAILDTIPIVKFGEKEPAKPADVELGSTAETRDVNGVNTDTEAQASGGTAATQHDTSPDSVPGATETAQVVRSDPAEEQQSGIAPAQPVAAGATTGLDNASPDEGLGCSICTEDFEKGQDLRVLPCDHKFHPECVDPWLLNVSGTCPLCRVDLRPVNSRDSTGSQEDELAPPLNPEGDTSHRRRTALFDILSLRQRPNASPEERISALRRLREQRRNQSGDVATGSANASTEDVDGARDRRNRRISARLSDVFSGRSRRERADESSAQQGGSHRNEADAAPGASGPSA